MGKGTVARKGIPKVVLMLTLKQWLAKYGTEPCDGCFCNIPQRAKCTYKSGYCIRYDNYRKEQKKRTFLQLKLF